MMEDEQRAVRALDRFYQAGYDALRRQHGTPRVDGLFVSDSGILFVRRVEHEPAEALGALLQSVEAINRAVLDMSYGTLLLKRLCGSFWSSCPVKRASMLPGSSTT